MRRAFLFLALLVLVAGVASAQTPVANPTVVEFVPSADHSAVDGITGLAIVTRYELRIFLEGASAPVQTTDLGKPTPVSNLISVTNPAFFVGLAEGIRHVARVAAIGPTGEGVSDLSNPFGRARTAPPAAVPAPVVR